ncbi:hypothetical protein FQN50_005123 [Emmonsiellopsis sp. PD_5]|nr:hypothetical protein FQN50_005123 [Emmonsiellopsis sp. PD_5]
MTVRKRNEFLDIDSSEGEGGKSDRGYDSDDDARETKGRVVKRRKLGGSGSGSDSESGSEGGESEDGGVGVEVEVQDGNDDDEEQDQDNDDENEEDEEEGEEEEKPSSKHKPLTTTTRKKNKTGVIYLSSLPPYLKPSALKSLLTHRGFGPITKIFLSPYTPPNSNSLSTSKKRNKRRTYTDGWVEFASKRTAKICAETLNAHIVGGKKGGWYHDDVWNMKYLTGYKWADLMEQVQRERAEREAKRRIEDSRARKEEKAFLEGVERGRVVEGIRRKRAEKGRGRVAGVEGEGEGVVVQSAPVDVRRVFRQNEVMGGGKGAAKAKGGRGLDPDEKRVLGKIF